VLDAGQREVFVNLLHFLPNLVIGRMSRFFCIFVPFETCIIDKKQLTCLKLQGKTINKQENKTGTIKIFKKQKLTLKTGLRYSTNTTTLVIPHPSVSNYCKCFSVFI